MDVPEFKTRQKPARTVPFKGAKVRFLWKKGDARLKRWGGGCNLAGGSSVDNKKEDVEHGRVKAYF